MWGLCDICVGVGKAKVDIYCTIAQSQAIAGQVYIVGAEHVVIEFVDGPGLTAQ
jgi:predicted Ser/Thr protein kinase